MYTRHARSTTDVLGSVVRVIFWGIATAIGVGCLLFVVMVMGVAAGLAA